MWFQELCSSKVDWDVILSGSWLKKWNFLQNEVRALSELQVPRCYFVTELGKPVNHEIHGFSDSSEKAMAAVAYLVSKYANGRVNARLIASKTRVAPMKKQSIPRLELLGAYLLAKLVFSVRSVFERLAFNFDTYYWVDSFTTLCWIRNNKPWRQYVQRRVNEIRRLSDKEKSYYAAIDATLTSLNDRFEQEDLSLLKICPGELNPVDIPSRGCAVKELVNNKINLGGMVQRF